MGCEKHVCVVSMRYGVVAKNVGVVSSRCRRDSVTWVVDPKGGRILGARPAYFLLLKIGEG